MAISDDDELSRVFKFVLGKAYTTAQKDLNAEDAASNLLIGSADVMSQDGGIPQTAPNASTSILNFYGDGSVAARFRMISDLASPLNTAFYASTDGTTLNTMRATRVPNWISPKYGNYTIRMFLTNGISTTTAYVQEIFFSDATSPVFDYKAGILTFENDPIAAYSFLSPTPDGIQISGYTYAGTLLSQIFDGNGNYTGGLSNLGDGSSVARFDATSKTLEVSAPHAIGSTWSTETTPYGTSNVMWGAITQTVNGVVIAVGGDEANTASYAAYSYGNGWKKALILSASTNRFRSVWASPDGYGIYAVDSAGLIGHSADTAKTWNLITPPITANAIWGNSATDIYIVGNTGGIAHSSNGTTFSTQVNSDSYSLNSVWGSGSTDIFAVGASGTIRHSTGSGTWTGETSGTSNALNGVFGFSSTEVYAVGANGTVLKYNGTTWSAFNTGIPSNFTCASISGVLANGVRRLYISGIDNSSNYHIYFSSGSNSWTSQNTFSGSATESGTVFAGINGTYVGLNSGRIGAIHQNYAEEVSGNIRVDGYASTTALFATDAELGSLNVNGSSTFTTTSPRVPALSVIGSNGISITTLTSSAPDAGEGIRLWREDDLTYDLELGSLASTNGDGTTPIAAGGRIRLGGFTTSPSTTSRAEIETVSSVGLKILAYQGDLSILNSFGTSPSTKGDITLSTQNGGIFLSANGSGSPTNAGSIFITPGINSSATVVLSTATTATSLTVQGNSGNFNKFFGDGSLSNTGGIITTTLSGSGVVHGNSITSTTSIAATTALTSATANITGLATTGSISTGAITASSVSATGNLVAQSGSAGGGLRIGAEADGAGNTHYGLHVNPSSLFGVSHTAAWGFGVNSAANSVFYDTVAHFSARCVGYTATVLSTTHSFSSNLASDPASYNNTGSFGGSISDPTFANQHGALIELQTGTSGGTGFTFLGYIIVY